MELKIARLRVQGFVFRVLGAGFRVSGFEFRVSGFGLRVPRECGQGNSNSHGARPLHQIMTMVEWIRTSRLSIKNSLSLHFRRWMSAARKWRSTGGTERPGTKAGTGTAYHPTALPTVGPYALLSFGHRESAGDAAVEARHPVSGSRFQPFQPYEMLGPDEVPPPHLNPHRGTSLIRNTPPP